MKSYLESEKNVINYLTFAELKRENGLKSLIQYLDVHIGKDELSDRYEKNLRPDGQNIHEFIAAFDSKYRKLWKTNINFPPKILACKVFQNSNYNITSENASLAGINVS